MEETSSAVKYWLGFLQAAFKKEAIHSVSHPPPPTGHKEAMAFHCSHGRNKVVLLYVQQAHIVKVLCRAHAGGLANLFPS